MRFRRSLQIAIDNFGNVFKLLLYRLVTTVIFGSIVYVILSLALSSITGSAEWDKFLSVLYGFFKALFTGETDVLHTFQEDFHVAVTDLVLLISTKSASIIWCVVGVCLIYLLSRFVNGLALFAIAGVVHDRMDSFSRTSFSQAYFRNLTSAALYQVIYVPLCFVYDALMVLACWFFFFYAPSFLPSWGFLTVLLAITLTLTALVCLEALKMTCISAWIPATFEGMGVGKALGQSFRSGKGFASRYVSFLVVIYFIIGGNILAGFATVGSALLLTVPFSYLWLLCVQFVGYYREHGKKYFASMEKIVGDEDTIE